MSLTYQSVVSRETKLERSVLELTRQLIRTRSINPPGDEKHCAALLGGMLDQAGFEVALYDYANSRTSLIAHLAGPADSAPICLTGHLDTVPLGAAPWKHNALTADVVGDRLYGRGSSDMKSGVAAMTMAGIAIARLPARKAGLVLVFTAGEETGCDGSRYLRELDVLPKAGALLVGEPTSNIPIIGHKGALWLEAEFAGLTAHGSTPEQGDNAVIKAARGVLRLADHDFHVCHQFLGKPTLNVASLHGGMNINSVPDRASIQIDVRTVPGQDNAAICNEIAALLAEHASLSRIVDVDPVASDPQNEWISSVFDLCERTTGQRFDSQGASFFTDAAVLTGAMGNVPTLILGPGEASQAHKTDEYCFVSRIEAATELYLEIVRRWMAL